MDKVLLVIAGGAIGALCRYGVSVFCAKSYGAGFPLGTLSVNIIGCFLIGLVFGLGELKGISPSFRLFFITGFLGALTTFSSYGLETINNSRNGAVDIALINIVANNIGGLAFVRFGLWFARFI